MDELRAVLRCVGYGMPQTLNSLMGKHPGIVICERYFEHLLGLNQEGCIYWSLRLTVHSRIVHVVVQRTKVLDLAGKEG